MSTSSGPLVIVGAGLAAGTLVGELRELGDLREIVVFGAEPYPPYERPPLSKSYLRGESKREAAYVHDQGWYDDNGVRLISGSKVHQIHLDEHTVAGRADNLRYSQLVLATGSRARAYPVAPTSAISVHHLRTFDDADRLRAALHPDTRLLIIGGGWIGLEVAASAGVLGARVTLVEKSGHLLGPVLGPSIGTHLRHLHESHGVDIKLRTGLVGLDDNVALLTDGTRLEVDSVLAGVGAVPNDSVAYFAGLKVQDGIQVDAGLATSDPDVFAIGDVASHQHPVLGERVRVEHWQNAVSQAKTLARILAGDRIVHDELPYFFSDQYKSGLEFFGHIGPRGADTCEVEPGREGALSVLWWRESRLVAAAHVNDWDRADELRARVGGET